MAFNSIEDFWSTSGLGNILGAVAALFFGWMTKVLLEAVFTALPNNQNTRSQMNADQDTNLNPTTALQSNKNITSLRTQLGNTITINLEYWCNQCNQNGIGPFRMSSASSESGDEGVGSLFNSASSSGSDMDMTLFSRADFEMLLRYEHLRFVTDNWSVVLNVSQKAGGISECKPCSVCSTESMTDPLPLPVIRVTSVTYVNFNSSAMPPSFTQMKIVNTLQNYWTNRCYVYIEPKSEAQKPLKLTD